MKESLFSIRVFARALAAILLMVMFFTIANNSQVISKGNETIQARQLETLTKVLITQAALSASNSIATQDQERLLHLTNQLAQDRLVFDATIYDAEGVRLASSSNALTAREVLGLDTPLSTASIGKQQLVEPIYRDSSLVGYVRVTFETGKVTSISDHHYRKSDRYMIVMILMSFISGVLITLLLRKKKIAHRTRGENQLLKDM
ncbi:YtjB family periplasmic protein [Vibrio maerlii]|uniref:YtjB family periplasmic protein n=1 Tax=Vibrio maerlii TaxID=2231648 RepID=UPI000E3B9B51|nr:YtjB family periplasmic protein [Vibrio maerlii]